MSEEKLSVIQDLLEDIKAILILSTNDKIQEAKKQLLKEGSEQKKICDLYDDNTTQNIANAIKKPPEYANSNLSQLRRKELIKTIERKRQKIHVQRLR